jgi:hypothetical protein
MASHDRDEDEQDEEEDYENEGLDGIEDIETEGPEQTGRHRSDQEWANELALEIRRSTFDIEECKKQIKAATKAINNGGEAGAHDRHVFWVHRLVGRQKYLEYAQPILSGLVAKGIFPVIPEETLKYRFKRMLGID